MALKHKITINVTDAKGRHTTVLRGAKRSIPERLVRFLFGDFTQVYLLAPGQTVESVDVQETQLHRIITQRTWNSRYLLR